MEISSGSGDYGIHKQISLSDSSCTCGRSTKGQAYKIHDIAKEWEHLENHPQV